MSTNPARNASPRARRWAQSYSRRVAALQKSIDQAEFIGWPALQQSFQQELDNLKRNAQQAPKARHG
jgi:hypothetical protein